MAVKMRMVFRHPVSRGRATNIEDHVLSAAESSTAVWETSMVLHYTTTQNVSASLRQWWGEGFCMEDFLHIEMEALA